MDWICFSTDAMYLQTPHHYEYSLLVFLLDSMANEELAFPQKNKI